MSSCVEKCRVWLSLRDSWHGQLVELQTPNDGIEEQEITPFVTEGRGHGMRAALDLFEIIDDSKVAPISKGIRIAFSELALLPLLILVL
jgi:hypothetical protein